MSDETQQTVETDAEPTAGQDDAMVAPESSSQEEPADPNTEALRILKETTGREFASLDEAKKHIQNLNSFVGNPTLRKNAELADKVIRKYAEENNLPIKEARAYIESLTGGSSEGSREVDPDNDKIRNLELRLEKSEFRQRKPEAELYLDKIENYAKATGKSFDDAYQELYGSVLPSMTAKAQEDKIRQEKKTAQASVSTSAPLAKEPNKYGELMKQYQATGKSEFLHEAMKIRMAGMIKGIE